MQEQKSGNNDQHDDADAYVPPVQIGDAVSIEDAWNSEPFERFRDKMRGACPGCPKKALCMGGCPLMPEIVFCKSEKRKTI